MDFSRLEEALLADAEPGDWLLIPDEVTGFSVKSGPRPWLVVRAPGSSPCPTLTPRSKSRSDGLPHAAHPQRPPHGPCRIDTDGYVACGRTRNVPPWMLAHGARCCREPDLAGLQASLRGRR